MLHNKIDKMMKGETRMKYVVISPKNKLICFEFAEQVAEYCMEKDNDYLNKYCEDQELEYENMTPVEIGYAYATIGAESGGCRVYETEEVLEAMVNDAVEDELVEEARNLFNNRHLEHEIECPGYLEDVLIAVTPVPVSSLSGNVYSGKNIDGASHDRGNPGV